MGLIKNIFGLGQAVRDVAEVFVPNRSETAKFEHLEHTASVEQFGAEFKGTTGGFHGFVDGLNRLPRPVLALGTVGLFAFSMVDPVAFSERMAGLDTVPRELWWLLGAIVSFYFGARELHYVRRRKAITATRAHGVLGTAPAEEENAAVADWLRTRG